MSDSLISGQSAGAIYDVRSFGAVGDGIADDTAEIQAAIDAAYAAGGGTVVMGAGTYKVSGTSDKSDGAIRLLDHVTLQGAGMGETIIKVQDNNPYSITGVVRTPYDEVTHDVAMFDLTIDGNRANNTQKIDGFYCGVAPGDPRQDYDITLERVEIMNCTGYGFDPHEQTLRLRIADSVSHHNVLDGFVADFLIDSVFENNIAYANDRHGFNVTTSTYGLQLLDNTAYSNGSAGLVIQRGSENITAPHDIIVEGGSYYNNAREGIFVKIADDVAISNVQVYGNQRQGVRIDGANNVVVDRSSIGNNSQASSGTYDEVRIGRYNDTMGSSGLLFDATGNVVMNTTIYGTLAARGRYGVYEALDVTGQNSLLGNTISGTTKGASYFAPQLVDPAEDQTAQAGQTFGYQVAPSSFFDADQNGVTLSANLSTGALPSWLNFNPVTGTFSGTPPTSGTYQIVVTATDAQGLSDVTGFDLVVAGGSSTDVVGTAGADTLIAGSGSQNLYGLAGDDLLVGGAGADVIDGGDGVDTASYSGSEAGVTVDLQAGTGVGGHADGDALRLVENVTGSALADNLLGDAGANVLNGGAGDDVLVGRAGADTLDGGAGADQLEGGDGNDVYLVDNAGDVVKELDNSGLGGIDTVLSTVSHTLGLNVENLELLGAGNLDATGNGKANRLTGNAGVNVLDGGAGDDTMIGGLGDDTYIVGSSKDLVTELAGEGVDTIRTTATRTLEAAVENMVLLGSGDISATGNALANVLTGNGGVNVLTGAEGDDTLLGGGGNDTLRGGAGADLLDGGIGVDRLEGGDGDDFYRVDNAGDAVVEFFNSGAGGIDTVESTVSLTLATNVENLTLAGTGNINGTGNAIANILTGNAGANLLDGGAGNDTLSGGLGGDRLIGRSGSDLVGGGGGRDTAVFLGSASTYALSTAAGAVQVKDRDTAADGNDGTDTLSSVETLEFKGGTAINLASAIVVDLDGDGVELVNSASSSASFDFTGDGTGARTGWLGQGDAFLVFDRDGNGTVSGAGELSFVDDKPGARSGLEGLSAFDSNADGAFSAADADFSRFLLWSDDGDGIAEAGELLGLAQEGVSSVALTGTAVARTWAAGANIVVNNGTIAIDGGFASLADVVLLHDDFGGAGLMV